ncbi:hypothetical protein DV737_g4859, partial [Chaetothyriales sp. CBS 132003]
MGKLIKNHWARLIVLTAATYQLAAALEGFFWPKVLWDFLTKNLDGAVKPFPTLQIINLLFSLVALAWEWPLMPLVKAFPAGHRSIEARLVVLPLSALAAILLYQATNAALYYIIDYILAEITDERTSKQENSLSLPLVQRILQEHFEGKARTRMTTDARQVVGKYIEIFVREAVMRSAYERSERDKADGAGGASSGWLEVEDLERIAPQLCLDF